MTMITSSNSSAPPGQLLAQLGAEPKATLHPFVERSLRRRVPSQNRPTPPLAGILSVDESLLEFAVVHTPIAQRPPFVADGGAESLLSLGHLVLDAHRLAPRTTANEDEMVEWRKRHPGGERSERRRRLGHLRRFLFVDSLGIGRRIVVALGPVDLRLRGRGWRIPGSRVAGNRVPGNRVPGNRVPGKQSRRSSRSPACQSSAPRLQSPSSSPDRRGRVKHPPSSRPCPTWLNRRQDSVPRKVRTRRERDPVSPAPGSVNAKSAAPPSAIATNQSATFDRRRPGVFRRGSM